MIILVIIIKAAVLESFHVGGEQFLAIIGGRTKPLATSQDDMMTPGNGKCHRRDVICVADECVMPYPRK